MFTLAGVHSIKTLLHLFLQNSTIKNFKKIKNFMFKFLEKKYLKIKTFILHLLRLKT